MELKGHLLYYPEGKHDINLNNYVQKSQLNDAIKSKVDSITKTTYADLKNLRDNSQLVPGNLYRITDYQCTTTQESTQSAGHQFDIVLLALSEDKLAEEGWAMEHPTDVYDVVCTDGVIIKCYYYAYYGKFAEELVNLVNVDTLLGNAGHLGDYEGIINHETKTITAPVDSATILSGLSQENLTYNYFQNSNLSAWKVWYCLDNDTSRFAWADDNVPHIMDDEEGLWAIRDASKDDYSMYAWYIDDEDETRFTKSLTPKLGDPVYSNATTVIGELIDLKGFGRGVIYRLIDEFNNDVAYDFKNIQYVRKLTDGELDTSNGVNTWVYTFNVWYNDMCQDASIVGNILTNDEDIITGVRNNLIDVIGGYLSNAQNARQALSDNCILSDLDKYHHYYGIYNCSIDASSVTNTISIENSSIHDICLKWSSRNKIKGICAIFMDCYDFNYNSDQEGGIYIQKKRVLTEP